MLNKIAIISFQGQSGDRKVDETVSMIRSNPRVYDMTVNEFEKELKNTQKEPHYDRVYIDALKEVIKEKKGK